MIVYGIDFTSYPSPSKPITCAMCPFENGILTVECFIDFDNHEVFENFLESEGPWIAGLDFPFGQPRALIRALGWPEVWEEYVGSLAVLPMDRFEALLEGYRKAQPPGSKHPLRITDARAHAQSPLTLYRTPVAKMFLRGAPRLNRSSACILPCRPNEADRVVVEAYPALVARRCMGRGSYKSDTRHDQTQERAHLRQHIVRRLSSSRVTLIHGFKVVMLEALAREVIQDPTGDRLDALLCAVQAAWAYTQRTQRYGIPKWADTLEGWIADPEIALG